MCVSVLLWKFVNRIVSDVLIIMQYELVAYTVCVCVCDLPLQFFAILNMLAALAYISQASSILWFPL